jgi:polyferredoxin
MTTLTPQRTGWDALSIPVLGRILKHRRGRLVLQVPMLLGALLLVYDGLTGPQLPSRNLATVGAWVHYRGFVILALLLAGNLFCMACPFTLPRTLAKRWAIRGRRFPKVLRNKWSAIAGLFGLFLIYEWFDLWASPALTAWIIVVYFVASFVLELVFSESAFCKYVCPIGTFNFVYSTASPLQIAAKDRERCRTCVGKECLNGSYSESPVILVDQIQNGTPIATHEHNKRGTLGCGTLLFVPTMQNSLDCTLCLDCVRACPHDNVKLAARPARQLLGEFPKRWDVTTLVVCLAFLGLLNAFGMVPPVYDLLDRLRTVIDSTGLWLAVLFGVGGILLPMLLVIGAAWLTNKVARRKNSTNNLQPNAHALRDTAAAFAPSFVPIGFGIWAAHYGFHFAIGALTIIPVFQNFLVDHGITILGAPNWSLSGLTVEQFAPIQVLVLCAGYLASMLLSRRTAAHIIRAAAGKVSKKDVSKIQAAWIPWALILLGMLAFALWLASLPMEMRGFMD